MIVSKANCYIPSFKPIGPVVLDKKIFIRLLPCIGMAAILVMWPGTKYTNFRCPFAKRLHMKFKWNWPSSFREEVFWKDCETTDMWPSARVTKWSWPPEFHSGWIWMHDCINEHDSNQNMHFFNFFTSLLERGIWNLNEIGLVVSEEKPFENVDRNWWNLWPITIWSWPLEFHGD